MAGMDEWSWFVSSNTATATATTITIAADSQSGVAVMTDGW